MAERYPEMLSIRQTAERTGLSAKYLRAACSKGEIPHIYCGRTIMVNFSALISILNTRGLAQEVDNAQD